MIGMIGMIGMGFLKHQLNIPSTNYPMKLGFLNLGYKPPQYQTENDRFAGKLSFDEKNLEDQLKRTASSGRLQKVQGPFRRGGNFAELS